MPLPYRYKSDYCRTLPTDFIFYATARLGPKGRHYALAVVSRRGKHDFSAMDVVKACVSIGRRLSCQANRAAIEGELNLARDFYAGNTSPYSGTPAALVQRVCPRAPGREQAHTSFFKTAEEEEEEERDARDAKPSWCRGHGERDWEKPVEFPFIATSLLLELGCDEDDGVALEPLGLTLDPNLGGLGMAVVDISDLDRVRHGVVAYWTSTLAPVEREPMVDYDFSDEDDFDDDTAYEYMWLNEERESYSKLPLTARQYCAKAGRPVPESLWNDEEGRSAMEEWRALENGVLQYIWPKSYIGHDLTGYDNSKTKTKATAGGKQVAEKSWREMMEETNTVDMFWEEELQMQLERESLDRLRREMEEHPAELGRNSSAGQLLALAYARAERVNWVRFANVSCEAILHALRQPEMQHVRTIAVSIQSLSESDCAAFLDVLAELPYLEHVCLLERPKRTADDAGMEMVRMLVAEDMYGGLLRRTAFTASGVCSRMLRGERIVMDGGSNVGLRGTFPVLKLTEERSGEP